MKKKTKKRSAFGKTIRALLIILLIVVLVAAGYVAYVLIAYHRLPDNMPLDVSGECDGTLESGREYSMISYNIGFAAYTKDFGFFMDGGTESRARSKESVLNVMDGITDLLEEENPDLLVVEEVDFDSDRSHHVDLREILTDSLDGYSHVFAQNYDSPYLFYPFTCPHGASKSGILTLSRFPITESVRYSLPIEESLMKLVDLDRCYAVSRIPVGEKELVVFSTHLSAYTSDGTIATKQVRILVDEMQKEYEKGNYVICAGDFNKDLLGKGSELFEVTNEKYTWAQPLPEDLFFLTDISLVAPFDPVKKVPSCRNADAPYYLGQYVITPDGFMVSDNVKVLSSEVIDTGFEFSDHNPVKMTFVLE